MWQSFISERRRFVGTSRTSFRRLLIASPVAFGCLTAQSTTAQTRATAIVAGCISDTIGQPLSGATVDIGGADGHRLVVSDASGCYVAPDVSAGPHYVFARLPRFVSVTRDNLDVAPGQFQKIDLEMRLAPICECLPFPSTIGDLWDTADAVVRLRIAGHNPSDPDVRFRSVLSHVWKRSAHLDTTDSLPFVRRIERDEVEPYTVGQEFIVFLKWSSEERAFVRMSSEEGTVAAFAIENGRIHSGPIAAYVGVDAGTLTDELASFGPR
jgi:hypothetical protein